MTYELELYTKSRVDKKDLVLKLERHNLRLLDEGNNEYLVASFSNDKPIFMIDDCVQAIEDEKPSFSGFSMAEFKYLLVASGSGRKDLEVAGQFLFSLAEKLDGAVFDPQKGLLLHPRRIKIKEEPLSRSVIDVLNVEWQFPGLVSAEQIKAIFECFERIIPWANPKRYKPLGFSRKTFSSDSMEDLLESFDMVRAMYWYGLEPLINAYLSGPRSINGEELDLSNRFSYLGLSLKNDQVVQDQKLCESLSTIFVELSQILKCKYASAFVVRRQHLIGDELASGGDSECITTGATTHWNGIPNVRSWLTWYDKEVLAEAAPFIQNHKFDGNFLRLGTTPRNTDELKDIFPEFPTALLSSHSGDRRG